MFEKWICKSAEFHSKILSVIDNESTVSIADMEVVMWRRIDKIGGKFWCTSLRKKREKEKELREERWPWLHDEEEDDDNGRFGDYEMEIP